MTTKTATIKLDRSGESLEYVATRDIRNAEHSNGTIEAGALVFFRRTESGIALLYAPEGRPTNGNQYVAFRSLRAAAEFATRFGLRVNS